jgi:hypothetical protein
MWTTPGFLESIKVKLIEGIYEKQSRERLDTNATGVLMRVYRRLEKIWW